MSAITAPPTALAAEPAPAAVVGRQQLLATFAFFLVLSTVYQTLVLTDVTEDVIRLGIEADRYQMLWVGAAWGSMTLFGIFLGLWLSPRIGGRHTLVLGLAVFALGNLLCGAAAGLAGMIAARLVEGIGKGMSVVMTRSTLYRQFDRALILAIGYYGVFAYATRHTSPMIAAYLNDRLSWRWIYWSNVPIALAGMIAVLLFVRPDSPSRPKALRMDWIAVALTISWVVSLQFAFGWYRRWGGWSSNLFTGTVALCVVLPVVLAARLLLGLSPDEHLTRLVRTRVYVLSMGVRALMLIHMGAVLTIMGKYLVGLRDYPRITAGSLMASTTVTMAATTLLTLRFRRRALRHAWLLVGVVGAAACLWWLSSIDNFTSKERITAMLACWGAFLGLFPPVFLTDEVEGLDPRDALYGGALGTVALTALLMIIPTATGTVTTAWSDRALDSMRLNLRENRPPVGAAFARISEHYRRQGLPDVDVSSHAKSMLGTYATRESVAMGYQRGLRFLSLVMLALGLAVAVPLARAARGLRAPPGAGYS
jgi:MFS family permease